MIEKLNAMLLALVTRVHCVIGRHERQYWTDAQCESAGVFDWIFRPWKCRHCDEERIGFRIPPPPPDELALPREPKEDLHSLLKDTHITLMKIEKHLADLSACVRTAHHGYGDQSSISTKHWND